MDENDFDIKSYLEDFRMEKEDFPFGIEGCV